MSCVFDTTLYCECKAQLGAMGLIGLKQTQSAVWFVLANLTHPLAQKTDSETFSANECDFILGKFIHKCEISIRYFEVLAYFSCFAVHFLFYFFISIDTHAHTLNFIY